MPFSDHAGNCQESNLQYKATRLAAEPGTRLKESKSTLDAVASLHVIFNVQTRVGQQSLK
jgi:hypothetical protein